mgnify:CR=1 FL=1
MRIHDVLQSKARQDVITISPDASVRDLLGTALEAHLALLSVSQNEDTRRLAAWAAIFAVPTAIAGIYGMNFDHMPELRWRFGYPFVLTMIVSTCLWLYVQFKRAKWL